MITATLGGLIKDYRIKKRISQLDISLKLGWKDTSRISKIEQGRVGKPNRNTAERIMNALNLLEQERGNFLLVGGYLPTDKEISKTIKETQQKINNWPYPAYIIDFTFRWLDANLSCLKALNMTPEQRKWIQQMKPNFLEFPFLEDVQKNFEIMKGEDATHLKPFQIAQVATFKTENEAYQNESWYKKLIKNLMRYDEFRKLWPNVDQSMYYKKLFDYEYKRITGTYEGRKRTFHFHIFTAKVINDPRFQIVLLLPADKQTEQYFTK